MAIYQTCGKRPEAVENPVENMWKMLTRSKKELV